MPRVICGVESEFRVEREKEEEEVKSRRKKKGLGSKLGKNRENWCEEESDSEEREVEEREDQESGKYYKRNDKNSRKRKIPSVSQTRKERGERVTSKGGTIKQNLEGSERGRK